MTEVRTDSGYVMLKQGIDVVISKTETTGLCDIYESDVLGLIQNDPRYAEIIKDTGDLKNMPQKHLEHKLMIRFRYRGRQESQHGGRQRAA